MKNLTTAIALGGLAAMSTLVFADPPIQTPADAFQAGKTFGQSGKDSAAGKVNTTTGSQNLPNFTTNAPQSANFANGKGNLGAAGNSKLAACQNSVSPDPMAQQECDAVNFLAKNPSIRPKFIIDKKNDPLLTGSANTIKNPGTTPGSSNQQCHVETVTTPATYKTESCEQSVVTQSFTCQKTLIPQCAYTGSPISSSNTSQGGAFVTTQITPTGTPGLYNYKAEVPYRNCGGDGSSQISFNLDTVGQGGYITINMSNLDDAAAVGVNGYTVFAGYPNNGPVYSGGFFPQTTKAYQIGYSWTEQVGTTCTAYDWDGNCTASAPNYQQFYANTKLLDFCPGGYAPTPQSNYGYCDGDGNCSPPSNYTPNNIMGFFCNAEGKFLMNRHEGGGTWGGSVSAQMPLQQGTNTIQVYWGTGPWGGACGNVTVSGQIYNVAPTCNTPWNDGCSAARGATQ
ncbi:hypothetical protein KXR69_25160 [Ralstonia holmesii]|uniref:hypothetical protein n=1 Tax=Ralstonia holmesii TaxID=3058602 RepID=UPI003F190B9B